MRLAPEVLPFFLLLAAAAGLGGWLAGWPGAALPFLGLAFTLWFFRDPVRRLPAGEGLIVSPADGRVVGVDTVEDAAFPGGRARRVSIFLSIFNVHVNRAPLDGVVTAVTYSPGRFHAAYRDQASADNERNRIDLSTAHGPVAVIQIAGAIARRIVSDRRAGDRVRAGERLGMIRFGSRVELLLPTGLEPAVERGDRVRTTASVIARRHGAEAREEEHAIRQPA